MVRIAKSGCAHSSECCRTAARIRRVFQGGEQCQSWRIALLDLELTSKDRFIARLLSISAHGQP